MKSLKASIAFLTLMALVITQPYGITYVEAQTAAPTTVGAATVPNYAVASMQALLGNANNQVSSAMAACNVNALAGDKTVQGGLTSLLTKGGKSTAKGATDSLTGGGDCSKVKSEKEFKCDMTCSEPTDLADGGSCEELYQATEVNCPGNFTGSGRCLKHTPLPGANASSTLASEESKQLSNYLSFLQFKSSTCVKGTLDKVNAEYAKYQCQMNALSSAVSQASTALQQALTANGQNYTKMTQFTKQVGDQMKQIDEILGPDPDDPNAKNSTTTSGLLGIQKSLNEQLGSWTANQATFKTSVDQISKDTTTNEQTLEADRMAQVTDCMKGNTNLGVSGGRSLTCYKPITQSVKDSTGAATSQPVTDASGNVKYSKQACGALEYVRSQVEQAPFRKGLNTQSRRDASTEYTTEFDSMVNSMMRDMGSYDAATADGKLVGRTTSWNDLAKKYAGDMQELSAKTGVNVAAQMNTVASSCYNSSYSWKNQQINSSASNYNKKKTEIQSNTNKLNAQLTQGLSDMNGQYASAMAILTNGQAVTLDRSSCTNNDPAKMETCYETIKDRMQGIMDGTGAVGTTTKSIAGGSMVPTFAVSCKGITGCVTTYQNIRKLKKAQATASVSATSDFVTNANTQVQNQLQAFAQNLAGLQQQVTAQFGSMQGMLAKLGVDTSGAKANYMTPEQLEQQKGPDGSMGPFGAPKSMAAVLSGMVQPTGLMNFQDTGVQDILKAAQDKAKNDKSDLADKIKTYQNGKKKLDSMASTCTKDDARDTGGGAGRVGATNAQLCRQISRCPTSVVGKDTSSILRQALAATLSSDAKTKDDAARAFDGLNLDSKCQDNVDACSAMIYGDGKESAYTSKEKGNTDASYIGN